MLIYSFLASLYEQLISSGRLYILMFIIISFPEIEFQKIRITLNFGLTVFEQVLQTHLIDKIKNRKT